MPPSYPISCPNCGQQLQPVRDLGPDSTPWLCKTCARGWWPAELTPAARKAWNPQTRSFDGPAQVDIRLNTMIDRQRARERGNSNLDDHPERPVPRKAAARKKK